MILLERTAAVVLLLVVAALGWIVAAAYWPDAVRLVSADVEVVVVLTLLVAALALVSTVALLHTRSAK